MSCSAVLRAMTTRTITAHVYLCDKLNRTENHANTQRISFSKTIIAAITYNHTNPRTVQPNQTPGAVYLERETGFLSSGAATYFNHFSTFPRRCRNLTCTRLLNVLRSGLDKQPALASNRKRSRTSREARIHRPYLCRAARSPLRETELTLYGPFEALRW